MDTIRSTAGGAESAATVATAFPTEFTSEQRDFLRDFLTAMSPSEVDRVMGWKHGSCARYVRCGMMSCIRMPGSKRCKVTPQMVAEFLKGCVHRERGPFDRETS